MEAFSLQGKVAIVTGARTGLGQGIAIGLARAGADIVGVGSTTMGDTERLALETGRRFLAISADLSCMDSIGEVLRNTLDVFGKVDILVNNAGIIRREEALHVTEKDWDDVMDLNLKSMFFLSQGMAKQFIRQGTGGKIINIASMLSYQGGIRVPAYTSSKSGVRGLTMALANEWAKYGIHVNAIAPGYMATDNTEALRKDEMRNAEILGRIPQGRWGKPEDLAGPCIFLSSEASGYINGCTIAVDGAGWRGSTAYTGPKIPLSALVQKCRNQ